MPPKEDIGAINEHDDEIDATNEHLEKVDAINEHVEEIERLGNIIRAGFTPIWTLQYPTGLTPQPAASTVILHMIQNLEMCHKQLRDMVEELTVQELIDWLSGNWTPPADTDAGALRYHAVLRERVETLGTALESMRKETLEGLKKAGGDAEDAA